MQLNELIDRASAIAGSDNKLAQHLGVARNKVSNWRHGQAGCGVEYRALMASMAGLDVDAVIHDALLEKHANTPLGERLLSALGNAVHGVAVTMLISVSAVFFGMGVPGTANASPAYQVKGGQCGLCGSTAAAGIDSSQPSSAVKSRPHKHRRTYLHIRSSPSGCSIDHWKTQCSSGRAF